MRARLFVLGIVVAAAGCGDGLGSPYPSMAWGPASNSLFKPAASSASGVVGDWFTCKDTSCTTLDDDGLRFTQDNRWYGLDAPGSSLEPGESYCEEQGTSQSGTYTIVGNTLTIKANSGPASQQMTFTMQGTNTALVTVYIEGQQVSGAMRRIVPSRSTGPCQDDQPPVPIPPPMP